MGAGVVLVEHYVSRHPQTRQIVKSGIAVILFRDRKTGRFTDAGGATDPGETAEGCATRELTEESAGLFRINLEDAHVAKYRVFLSSGYTAFVVPVRHRMGIKKGLYMRNATDIASTDAPYFLKETDDMRRFFVNDLVSRGFMSCNSKKASSMAMPDAYGSQCFISKRTACVLQKAFSAGLFMRKLDWNYLQSGKSIFHRNCLHTYTVSTFGAMKGLFANPCRNHRIIADGNMIREECNNVSECA